MKIQPLKKGGDKGNESIPLRLSKEDGMMISMINYYNDTTLETREGTRGNESIPL